MVYTYRTGKIVPIVQKHFKLIILAVTALFVSSLIAMTLSVSAANSTEVVSGNTADTSLGENGSVGWWFDRDATSSTDFEFSFAESSTGDGSIFVPPIGANASDKFVAEYFYLDDISNVTSVSFDFKTVNPADVQDFYMNLYVNDGLDPTEFYDCRYNIVPTTFTPGSNGFMTVSYDLSTPTSVTQRGSSSILPCPSTPTSLPTGAVLRAIAINVGQSNANDLGTSGYIDNVVLTEGQDSTVFDFEPIQPTGEIVTPTAGEVVSGNVNLTAAYDDGNEVNDDGVQWAVRTGTTCAAGSGNVAGNVGVYNDPFNWDGASFSAVFNSYLVEDGNYCFVFNPSDDQGQNDVREVVAFVVDNRADNKDECKNGGWTTGLNLTTSFRNQGDCVSYFASSGANPPANGATNERANRNR